MKKDILIIMNKHISWESNNLCSSAGSLHISGPPVSSPSITHAQTGIRLFLRALPHLVFCLYHLYSNRCSGITAHIVRIYNYSPNESIFLPGDMARIP